jgi:predicted ATPase
MCLIATPDQRLRVFVSSTLEEMAGERAAAREAIESLRLTPVMFELGARPYAPRELYGAYLAQSDVFVGIYGERYGWVGPGADVSGLEDEYQLAEHKPRLLYVKRPAPARDAQLTALMERIKAEGTVSYRTFEGPEELRRLLVDDLALLLSEHFQGDRQGAATTPEHNVPMRLTTLLGRERELEGIGELLRGSRLVTLVGPGGVGKTSLALEVARRQIGQRADGVWLVDLATGPDMPDPAVETARVLAVQAGAGTTLTNALRRYLVTRDVLLVLDNCEHVIDAAAELAAALLTACASVRILATSREPLGLDGETVWRLDPLEPEAASQLFVGRARQRRPEFDPDVDMEATITQLCARVDRLPLAIELAAVRVSVMSLEEILSGLETRLGELGGGKRPAAAHHRSVRAAVEWSYRLLDRSEQDAFRALAVFAGGFDGDAARAVAPALSPDVLARLVDKSLVSVAEAGRRTRYRLLETVREYASELLVEAEELDGARERHLRHYSALASTPEDGGPMMHPRVIAEVVAEYENVRAALEWAAATDPCAGRPLFVATKDLFWVAGGVPDGRRLAQELLERCPTRDRSRAELQIISGFLAFMISDIEWALNALREAQELSADLAEPVLEGWAHFYLGLAGTLAGATGPARDHIDAARALFEEAGESSGWARATTLIGLQFLMADEPARARELVEQALAVDVREHDDWGQGQSNLYLGIIAESTATDPQVLTSHYREAVERLRPFRFPSLLSAALIGQAGVLARRDPARALRVVAAAYALSERSGAVPAPFFGARAERVRASAEAELGANAGDRWAEGARLAVDEAIALAFETEQPAPGSPEGSSVRGGEMARLAGDEVSNEHVAS